MNKLFMMFVVLTIMVSCNNEKKETADTQKTDVQTTTTSTVSLPYKANYSSQFNDKVSDSDLLTVLNSYKYWETGDLTSLSKIMGDSVYVNMANGMTFKGTKDSLMGIWKKQRDSLSAVSISVDAWVKSHSIDKNENYVEVWCKEIDTYKSGKVDSANYADLNQVKNGKITWYSSYRQPLMKK